MLEATTILLFNDSLQAERLGDACLISILSTISSMLHLLLDMIPPQWIISTKEKFTPTSITEEDPFNHCTENMEVFFQECIYEDFMRLHELFKAGIKEYISNNNNQINDTTRHELPSFHIHNGEIRSEICLAVALRYFTGGSYLDITISHRIGKTDIYHSIWAVVHATNRCPRLQFQFPATVAECQEIAVDFTFRSKAGLDNCVGCIDGMLLWIVKPFPKECEKVGVDSGKFYCSQKANSA